jgi:hypothetical protein
VPPQDLTSRFLAHLVQRCSLHSKALLGGLLRMGLKVNWCLVGADTQLLAALLAKRVEEAALSGHFCNADSPLSALAGRLARRMLTCTSEPLAMPSFFCVSAASGVQAGPSSLLGFVFSSVINL